MAVCSGKVGVEYEFEIKSIIFESKEKHEMSQLQI